MEEVGYDTASEVLDGQGRGVSDDSESGVDGALESVKVASRELLPTLAGAGTTGNGCFGHCGGSAPARVPRWLPYTPSSIDWFSSGFPSRSALVMGIVFPPLSFAKRTTTPRVAQPGGWRRRARALWPPT